ncbi:MAG: hypothetical protein S4CHLAM20_14840 [Chlamydiia bacterium]|nr:hypothetical protein [Chlamydiia bacterium]
MNREKVINEYFCNLEKSAYSDMIELFTEDAVVESPLLGTMKAAEFYKEIFSKTSNSKITLMNVCKSVSDENTAVAHFHYDWILSDGMPAPFECVDIFTFQPNSDKIVSVKIIYDSFKTRDQFAKIDR